MTDEPEMLYIMSDEDGDDSAAIARVPGRTRFIIYDNSGGEHYVDMTDEVVRQVQAALAWALESDN